MGNRLISETITVPIEFSVALVYQLEKEFVERFSSIPQVMFVGHNVFYSPNYSFVGNAVATNKWSKDKYIYGCRGVRLRPNEILLSDGFNELIYEVSNP